jgi:putative PIN family toxin of toxin-antitoxin system
MLFVRAASRPHRVHTLFDLVDQGHVQLVLSPEVLAEIRDVLTRPKLVAKFPALTQPAVDAFLAKYMRAARWVTNVQEHYVLQRDPKDSKYLNLAIEGQLTYVVSDDLDLLDLMESSSTAGQDFRGRFPNIRIVRPRDFAAIVSPASP